MSHDSLSSTKKRFCHRRVSVGDSIRISETYVMLGRFVRKKFLKKCFVFLDKEDAPGRSEGVAVGTGAGVRGRGPTGTPVRLESKEGK